jgi:adenine-specific DNA-methyltransferase
MTERLEMCTKDLSQEKIRLLSELFPNCITESKENEKVVRSVDFDALRQELSDHVIEGPKERYQFTWPDKNKARVLANTPTTMTLRPCREESVDFDTTKNLYIEGDNLEVLKILRETYLGKVKMIYIDPPYNTGNDFVYDDDYSMSAEEYSQKSGDISDSGERLVLNTSSNGRFHTDWLNMIYPRLLLAKDLLKDNGVIFISIDDNEVVNLVKICNEIFGENNFAGLFPWQSRQSIQNDTDISINHEYVVAYAKVRRQSNRRLKESNASTWFKEDSFVFLPIELDQSKFDNPDNDPRGLWKADPMDAPNVRPNLTYTIINPKTGESYNPPQGRHWRFEKKKFEEALADNRIVWGKNGEGKPQLKVFYSEKQLFGSVDNSWWSGDRFGTSTFGTKELIKIFDGKAPFDTPKPTKLIINLIKLVSRPQDGDIILDFFSGSATTADSLININSKDGGNRSFIMVQTPDNIEQKGLNTGYNNICEIGKERIRRAGFRLADESIDSGFRVYKLDSSNMTDVFFDPESFKQMNVEEFGNNVKPDRSSEDLLTQAMLELGIKLSAKIETESIENNPVSIVDDGYLVACLSNSCSESIITALAKREIKPTYAVIRNGPGMTDQMLSNIEQIFKTYSPGTEVRLI